MSHYFLHPTVDSPFSKLHQCINHSFVMHLQHQKPRVIYSADHFMDMHLYPLISCFFFTELEAELVNWESNLIILSGLGVPSQHLHLYSTSQHWTQQWASTTWSTWNMVRAPNGCEGIGSRWGQVERRGQVEETWLEGWHQQSPLHCILCPMLGCEAWGFQVSSGKVSSTNIRSPTKELGTFSRGRGQKSVSPMDTSSDAVVCCWFGILSSWLPLPPEFCWESTTQK